MKKILNIIIWLFVIVGSWVSIASANIDLISVGDQMFTTDTGFWSLNQTWGTSATISTIDWLLTISTWPIGPYTGIYHNELVTSGLSYNITYDIVWFSDWAGWSCRACLGTACTSSVNSEWTKTGLNIQANGSQFNLYCVNVTNVYITNVQVTEIEPTQLILWTSTWVSLQPLLINNTTSAAMNWVATQYEVLKFLGLFLILSAAGWVLTKVLGIKIG